MVLKAVDARNEMEKQIEQKEFQIKLMTTKVSNRKTGTEGGMSPSFADNCAIYMRFPGPYTKLIVHISLE